jgi:hypothetical protein
MSFEPMDTARHSHATKRFPPGPSFGSIAARSGEGIRRAPPPPDNALDRVINIYEGPVHRFKNIG